MYRKTWLCCQHNSNLHSERRISCRYMFRNWHAFYSKLATPKLQQWWWNEKKNTWQKNIRIYSFIFAKLHTNGLYLHLLLTTIYFNFSSTGSFKDLYPPAEFMNHVIAINEKGKVRVRSAIMIYIYRDLCKFFVKKYDHLFYERKREKERGVEYKPFEHARRFSLSKYFLR